MPPAKTGRCGQGATQEQYEAAPSQPECEISAYPCGAVLDPRRDSSHAAGWPGGGWALQGLAFGVGASLLLVQTWGAGPQLEGEAGRANQATQAQVVRLNPVSVCNHCRLSLYPLA